MPETGDYLILALVVTAIIVLGFIGSMVTRYQSLKKDIAVIDQIREEDNQ